MLIAINEGHRVRAEATGQRASCPQCDATMVAKCGTVVIHHWAHKAAFDPLLHDSWGGPMTEFHRQWQEILSGGDPDCLEVRVTDPAFWHEEPDPPAPNIVIEHRKTIVLNNTVRIRSDEMRVINRRSRLPASRRTSGRDDTGSGKRRDDAGTTHPTAG